MRILLFVDPYLNLYKPIERELFRQGHDVRTFLDPEKFGSSSFMFPKNFRALKKYLRLLCQGLVSAKRYWKRELRQLDIFNETYDILFVINGVSFHPIIIEHLQQFNPRLKVSLYVWDNAKGYDFFHFLPFVHKAFTFDFDDAKRREGVEFLPFYWTEDCQRKIDIKYDVSIIGSNHHGRLEIVEKIAKQLKERGMRFYFKIYIFECKVTRNPIVWMFKRKRLETITNDYRKQLDSPYTTKERISPLEVENIIASSNCILDTDNPNQTGTTPRVIWALAASKKIISTNTNLKDMPFYNPNQISFINRENPVIDWDFLELPNEERHLSPYIENLRIDKWVRNFLI